MKPKKFLLSRCLRRRSHAIFSLAHSVASVVSLRPSSLSSLSVRRLSLSVVSLRPSSLSRRRLCRSRAVVSVDPSSLSIHLLRRHSRSVVDVGPSSLSSLSVRRLSRCMRRLSPSVFSLDSEYIASVFLHILLCSVFVGCLRIGVVWKRQWNPRESLRDGFNFIKARG
ncbi:hypothetical protein F2Q69_00014000 [Brassica cretica]|uniref:Transmembrane protein n=1 Tax=Brassica cretica TaxID=69181 RepID=A0A8S9R658_BRACR|nr:hypothetical protein F2Q69_00014000 [Brassica cretica]